MRDFPSDVAFTDTVKAIQHRKGSRSSYARMELEGSWETTVTPELEAFLADLEMFYLGTSNAEAQPYIQYRGGSPGILKKVDERTLGFADFGGNRQYITIGNLSENPKAFIFRNRPVTGSKARPRPVSRSALVGDGYNRRNVRCDPPARRRRGR